MRKENEKVNEETNKKKNDALGFLLETSFKERQVTVESVEFTRRDGKIPTIKSKESNFGNARSNSIRTTVKEKEGNIDRSNERKPTVIVYDAV